jgi:tight adherence protein B
VTAVLACALFTFAAVLLARPRPRTLRVLRGGRDGPRIREPFATRGPAGCPVARLTAEDIADLADRLAALTTAGLPVHRAWSVLANHGPSPSIRAAAVTVVAGQRRGLASADALRVHLATAGPKVRGARRPVVPARSGCSGESMVAAGAGWLRGRSRSHDQAAAQLAVALEVSELTGAGLAETLQRFAGALRADERAAEERAAALAGPQATASVLGILPLAGIVLGVLVGGRPWHALLATTPGRVCLTTGSVLWIAGRWWTSLLVRRARGSS